MAAGAGVDGQIRLAAVGLLLPALTYCIAYSFLGGEAAHFGVPLGLISVSVSDVLKIGFTLGTAVLVVALAIRGLIPVKARRRLNRGLEGLVWPSLLLFVYAAANWWAYGAGPQFRLWITVALLGVSLALVAVMVGVRRTGSLKAALDKMAREESSGWWSRDFWSSAFSGAMHLRVTDVLIVVVAAAYLMSAVYMLGRGYARNTIDFMVPVSSEGGVVVLVNDGRAVMGHMDENGLLGPEFESIELSALGEVREQSVGPLKAQGLAHGSE